MHWKSTDHHILSYFFLTFAIKIEGLNTLLFTRCHGAIDSGSVHRIWMRVLVNFLQSFYLSSFFSQCALSSCLQRKVSKGERRKNGFAMDGTRHNNNKENFFAILLHPDCLPIYNVWVACWSLYMIYNIIQLYNTVLEYRKPFRFGIHNVIIIVCWAIYNIFCVHFFFICWKQADSIQYAVILYL